MGAVLAMSIILFSRYKPLALLAFSLVLNACGNTGAQPLGQVASAVVTQLTTATSDADDVQTQLTPAVVAAVQEPFLLVSLPARNASATLRAFAAFDGRTDWRGGDGIAFVLADDIIIATRGLGADLFLAEAPGLRMALADRSGAVTRRHSHLDGENREVVAEYACTIAVTGIETIDLIARNVQTEKVTETCLPVTKDGQAFINSYWIGVSDRLIWQSEQWISHDIAYALIRHIKR